MRKDKKLLFDGYFRAGMGEYWLINALDEKLDFQVFTPSARGFVPVAPQAGWLESPTFQCAFQPTRQKGDDGFWQYTLGIQKAL